MPDNLPSTDDEIWDEHLLELIDSVRNKKWLAASMVLNRMTKEVLYRLKERFRD